MIRSALTVKGISAEKQPPKDFGIRSAPSKLSHIVAVLSLLQLTFTV